MPKSTTSATIPSDHDTTLARAAASMLDSAQAPLTVQIVGAGKEGISLELPAAAAALLKTMLNEMAAGRAVSVVPIDTEITTGDAAELLRVSRPFVVGLIEKGALPARMIGTHRRVKLEDVLAYKRDSKAKALIALKEMVAISQELGLE